MPTKPLNEVVESSLESTGSNKALVFVRSDGDTEEFSINQYAAYTDLVVITPESVQQAISTAQSPHSIFLSGMHKNKG